VATAVAPDGNPDSRHPFTVPLVSVTVVGLTVTWSGPDSDCTVHVGLVPATNVMVPLSTVLPAWGLSVVAAYADPPPASASTAAPAMMTVRLFLIMLSSLTTRETTNGTPARRFGCPPAAGGCARHRDPAGKRRTSASALLPLNGPAPPGVPARRRGPGMPLPGQHRVHGWCCVGSARTPSSSVGHWIM
jgi:hypothetical protein